MTITATELKQNLGKYLRLAETEDVIITRSGRIAAKLTRPYPAWDDMAEWILDVPEEEPPAGQPRGAGGRHSCGNQILPHNTIP